MSESPIPPLSHSLIPSSSAESNDRVRQTQIGENYGRLPLSFEENLGQVDKKVKFLSRGSGYTLFLTSTEAVLVLSVESGGTKDRRTVRGRLKPPRTKSTVLRMKLLGANPAVQVTGVEELPGKSNYFIGGDPAKWRTNISTYARVKFEEVYPGIDLVYYGNQRQLEYDWIVSPGADPRAIKFVVEGAKRIKVDSIGDLVLAARGGEVRLRKPVVYQETDGVRHEIAGYYVPGSNQEVTFAIADYNRARPLVIDPVLFYSTYLGGAGADRATAIAVDSSGNAYVTGLTSSANFPTVGTVDVFVTKLNPSGSALIYSTYHGGSSIDWGLDIAVDSLGNAYVTGYTESTDFSTANARQPAIGGNNDAFVTKFNSSGNALLYSTYHGGSGNDRGAGIAVDASGNAYVTGNTGSTDFPTANPLQPAYAGLYADAFVTKFNPSGSALVYSTYHGGTGDDYGAGIAVDASGNAYVTGNTQSANFPIANPLQPAFAGNVDVFVTKFNPSGSALIYSTYNGGSAPDYSSAIAVDSSSNVYVTGYTQSTNFPTANPRQPAFAGDWDGFVTKYDSSGNVLVYSTYHGGRGTDEGFGIAVDSSGNAYVTGYTASSNFPTSGALQLVYAGLGDAFITKFNDSGSALLYSTYYGGFGYDTGAAIAVDSLGNAYVTGQTDSSNFPTAYPFQPSYGGGFRDAFVLKISPFARASFPQMAVGGGFSTIFTVGNTGATTLTGNLILTDQEGNPWTVNGMLSAATANPRSAPGGGQIHIMGSSFAISIPPSGTAFLTASSLNSADPIKSGWAELETSGGSLTAVATFQFVSNGVFETIAGVLASQPLQYAAIPVDNDDSQNRFTGYAIANPGPKSISIKLATVSQSGIVVDDSVVITLGPGQQVARFLHQDLPARLKFKGSIVLRGQSDGTFAVVALVQNQDQFTVIPVSAEKAPHIPN